MIPNYAVLPIKTLKRVSPKLAVTIKKGFEKTASVDTVNKGFEKTATIEHISNEVKGLKKWAEGRFDKIEKVILDDHKERIAKLETNVTYLENILNLNVKR